MRKLHYVVVLMALLGCQREESELSVYALVPLTGNVAHMGECMRNGLSLIEQTPTASISIQVDDSKADPKEGIMALRRKVLHGKPSMMVTAISGVAMAVKPMAEQAGILHFSMVGTPSLLTDNDRFTYRFFPTTDYVAAKEMEWIKSHAIEEIAVLYINNEWGHGYCDSMRSVCARDSINIKYCSAVEVNRDEYANISHKILESNVSLVCISMQGDAYAEMVRKLRMMGYGGKILCDMNFTGAVAGRCKESLNDVYVLDFKSPSGALYERFVSEYEKRFGGVPDMPAVIAYEVVRMIESGMKTVGENAWYNAELMQGFEYNGLLGTSSVIGREIRFPMELKSAGDLLR